MQATSACFAGLLAARHQFARGLRRCVGHRARRRPDGLGEMGDRGGIEPIGLGELSGQARSQRAQPLDQPASASPVARQGEAFPLGRRCTSSRSLDTSIPTKVSISRPCACGLVRVVRSGRPWRLFGLGEPADGAPSSGAGLSARGAKGLPSATAALTLPHRRRGDEIQGASAGRVSKEAHAAAPTIQDTTHDPDPAGVGSGAVLCDKICRMHARRRGRADLDEARRRRSNRPGNSQAKGPRAEGRSGKQRPGDESRPLTEGVSPAAPRRGRGESLRVHDRGGISRTQLRPLGRRCPGVPQCRYGRAPLQRTPLHALHRALAAHGWCRSPAMRCRCSTRPASSPSICTPAPQAGLFDVSHMGQIRLRGADAAPALEALVPGDIAAWRRGRMRYTLLLNEPAASSTI